jgi:hypothetical protein
MSFPKRFWPGIQFLTEAFAKVLYVVRQGSPELVEGLTTNGKKSMIQRQLPFALSLSKGVFRVLQEAQLTENMDPR